ncbi:MAG: thiamine pyrophosphate-dependent enzyme [Chloroflexi bacterium]|nr:thiamine pyrophosphate-dependent enzyme [Chloroflexota bacterium]
MTDRIRINLKDIVNNEERLAPGHRLCGGCGEPTIMRMILHAIEGPVVISTATGCLEVSTTVYPTTAWQVPWIHSAFENSATTISGVEAAYKALKRSGKIPADKEIKFLAVGGDGASYDIGFQWISGALERGHKLVYVCLNNEAYMNTGIQRSGATPKGANTTTSPVGDVIPGKTQWRKPFTRIMAAHDIPYVAQAAPHNYRDLMTKVKKAFAADGPAVLNILAPCPRGWRTESDQTMVLTKLAADTCYWPLYEVDHGKTVVNYKPREKKPVADWLKVQGRFRHLFRPAYASILEEIQARIDQEWERLLKEEAAG